MNLGYLLVGLVFLFNPNINVIDVLPDVIGCLFILKGLSRLSDLNRHIASARAKFRRLTWIALFKSLVSLFTSGILDQALYGMRLSILVDLFDSTMVLVFVFVFGIFELIYMIPAFISLFEGIAFLEIRHTDHRARRTNFAKPRFGGVFDKVEFADGTAFFEVYTDTSDEAVTAKLARDGYDPKFGARPLRRLIQRTVEDTLSEEVLQGRVRLGSTVRLTVREDRITVETPEEAETDSAQAMDATGKEPRINDNPEEDKKEEAESDA